jgi:hypothetical protein
MPKYLPVGVMTAALVALAVPARAADFEKYLPDDTDTVLTVNVRQGLESALGKKHRELAAKLLKDATEVREVLDDLGFDPFKDVQRVTVAIGENAFQAAVQPGGLGGVIVQGKFDLTKFNAKADEVVKSHGEILSIEHVGKARLYKVAVPDMTIYVALPDRSTLVASPVKENVTQALEKAAGQKKTALKNKTLTQLLAKFDDKQSLTLAMTAQSTYGASATVISQNGATVAKVTRQRLGELGIESVLCTAAIAENVDAAFTAVAKDEQTAKNLSAAIQEGLKVAANGLAGLNAKGTEPLVDFLKKVQVTTSGKALSWKGQVPASAVEGVVALMELRNRLR